LIEVPPNFTTVMRVVTLLWSAKICCKDFS
jgi:hypothetical protein